MANYKLRFTVCQNLHQTHLQEINPTQILENRINYTAGMAFWMGVKGPHDDIRHGPWLVCIVRYNWNPCGVHGINTILYYTTAGVHLN